MLQEGRRGSKIVGRRADRGAAMELKAKGRMNRAKILELPLLAAGERKKTPPLS